MVIPIHAPAYAGVQYRYGRGHDWASARACVVGEFVGRDVVGELDGRLVGLLLGLLVVGAAIGLGVGLKVANVGSYVGDDVTGQEKNVHTPAMEFESMIVL